MGQPVVSVLVFLAFMATEVIYVWLWPTPVQRLLAATVVVIVLVVTVVMLRSGAMRPRAVVEVRRDVDSGRDRLHVVSRGSAVRTDDLPPGDRIVDLPLAPLGVPEVHAWAHQVDGGGESEPLSMTATVRGPGGDTPQEVQNGAVDLDVQGGGQALELRLPSVSRGGRR